MIDLKTVEEPARCLDKKGASGHGSWSFCTLQALAVLALVILSLEYLFGLAGIGEEEYLKPDPVLGFSPMPNKHVTKTDEAFGQALYNRYGLPEPERSLNKPANTYRIVVLGDSFVEALQVDRKENFCFLLEEALSKKYPGMHFEVMNFGVAGYSLGQMYLRLKNLAFKFHPDMVLLAVRADTTFVLRPTPAIDLTSARPSFFIDGNNQLITDYTVHNSWLRTTAGRRMQMTGWLREHSRIWGVVSVAVQQMLGWYQGLIGGTGGWGAAVTNKQTAFATSSADSKPAANTGVAAPKTFMIGNTVISSNDYYDARDRGIRYFWPIVDAIIVAINKECAAHKCSLLIAQLPGAGGTVNHLETSMFKQTADRLHIPFVDDTATLAKEPVDKVYYKIHFTPFGHKLFARQLVPFVWQHVSRQQKVRADSMNQISDHNSQMVP